MPRKLCGRSTAWAAWKTIKSEPRFATNIPAYAAKPRLAESRLATDPEMGPALLRLASDSDPVVRYQTALSLGEWDDSRAGGGLGRLAESAGHDPWIRAALLSSAAKRPGDVFAAVLAAKLDDETRAALVEPLIASIAGAKDQEAARTAIRAFAEVANHPEHPPAWQFAALAGVLDAANPQDLPAALEKMIDAAPRFAEDSQAENAERVAAIRLLGRRQTARGADLELLGRLLAAREPKEIQRASLRALDRLASAEAAKTILRAGAS